MANCNKAPKAITFGSRVWHTIKLLVLGLIEVVALVFALKPVLNIGGGIMQDITNNIVQVGGCALVHIFFVFMFARCRTNWKLRKIALANYVPEEEVVEEEVVEEAPAANVPQIRFIEYVPGEETVEEEVEEEGVLSKKEAKKAAKEAKKAAKAAKKAAKAAKKAAKKAKKEEVEEEVEEEVKAPVTNYPQITIIEYDPDEE